MGLTSMWLRQWKDARVKKMRAELESPSQAATLADLPAAGARWRRNPDGTWMRWSYLGETWETQTAPPALLSASEQTPGVTLWIVSPQGAYKPFEETPAASADPAPAADAAPVAEQLPPPPPPKLNPEFVARPEWTSDWKPGWTEPK